MTIYLPQQQNMFQKLLPTLMQGMIQHRFQQSTAKSQAEADRAAELRGQEMTRSNIRLRGEEARETATHRESISPTKTTEQELDLFRKKQDHEYKIFELKEKYKRIHADPKLTVEQKKQQTLDIHRAKKEIDAEFTAPPKVTETPEQKRKAGLQIKKDFAVWKHNFEKTQPGKPEEGLNANQRRIREENLVKAESLILGNSKDPAVRPHVKYVNTYLNKEPYIYTWATTESWRGKRGEAVRVDLPDGVTAEDMKFTAKDEGKSLYRVLKEAGYLK